MEVSEINTRRFDVALELLREGKSFTFDGVNFWIALDGSLNVRVYSSWQISNITEQNALSDFERAKSVYAYLVRESSAFASLVESRPQNFSLLHDSGNSTDEVGRLVGDNVVLT